ncbi:MAG TPA: ABC transporter permease [Thermoanaerobaculia bacterium]|nr:ABC transporter permease [Thermoanaerobaculia bacterium]
MRLTRVLIRHEWLTQLGSLRFRIFSVVYVVLCCVPSVMIYLLRDRTAQWTGPGTYAVLTANVQPLLTALFAAVVSVDAVSREREEGSFTVLSIAPYSNSGYMLRRWVAVMSVILPITMLPPLISFAIASKSTGQPLSVEPFYWPWLLQVATMTAVISALALAFGAIAGGAVKAAILCFILFNLLLGYGNDILLNGHRGLEGPGEWFGTNDVQWAVSRLGWAVTRSLEFTSASDRPFDVAMAIHQMIPRSLLLVGFTFFFFGISVFFLRRTRRDIRGWRVAQDHPLRTFVAGVNRMREEYAPDPKVTFREWAVVTAGAVGLILTVRALLVRFDHYHSIAAARFAAEESGGPQPADVSIVPVAWQARGRIASNSAIDLDVTAIIRNDGKKNQTHLAFTLNPALGAAVTTKGGAKTSRSWDRLAVDLLQPLVPGEERALRFHISGRSVWHDLPTRHKSFVDVYEVHRNSKDGWGLQDFSRTLTVPAVTRGRVSLQAEDLFPVLRHTTWQLTPRAKRSTDPGRFVPLEAIFPMARIEVDLDVPEGVFLSDSCGALPRREAGRVRLRGACPMSLHHYRIAGGRLQPLRQDGAIVAMIPEHRTSTEAQLVSFSKALSMVTQAWPQIDPRGTVFMEWSPGPAEGSFSGMWHSPWDFSAVKSGKLLLIPESTWTARAAVPADRLAALLISVELQRTRPIVPAESLLFMHFYRHVTLSRLGSAAQRELASSDTQPGLLSGAGWDWGLWEKVLPAVMMEIEQRIGSRNFIAALDEFISDRSGNPGTAKELLGRMTARSGVPLDRIYKDFFIEGAVPHLTLETVTVRRESGVWVVGGEVRNKGTGESFVPLVLECDGETMTTLVRVDSNTASSFTFRSPSAPQVLNLDPRGVSYRRAPVGTVQSFRFGGTE